ncbi:unnamed protein product [Didymodactylos carnosus]|uniref:Uncharacterized protein n=1 Tax=Didymodactylos carnosus TaxID=1234261 RepID=A0A815YHA5_9BILA|nr:unnamed protein product [Didymodactylos carnosus]CAF1569758.1 unnamed protein product [Didymodactylos carnosus]CAF3883288.1 unnamed protein product [Didymodactylos carnosus]CAF4432831.1 unnamed protein product [Didymodactylos carnosus]
MKLVSGFSADLSSLKLHEQPGAFEVAIPATWTWFYLRKQQLLLFFQDPTHLATKLRNRLLSKSVELKMGEFSITLSHLTDLIENNSKLDHGLVSTDIFPKDRQNYASFVKISSANVLNLLSNSNETQATFVYLQLLSSIIIAYIDQSTPISNRLYHAWVTVFVSRFWWTWLKHSTFLDKSTKKSLKQINKYFITTSAFYSIELNAHNLLYLTLLVIQEDLPVEALNVFLFNSQACEATFRNARSLRGVYSSITNFTVNDFLRRAQKLSVLNEIKAYEQLHPHENEILFPVYHKHKKHSSNLIDDNPRLKITCIETIINNAYQQAKKIIVKLKMSALLKQNKALELNDLNLYVRNHLTNTNDHSTLADQYESESDSDNETTTNNERHGDNKTESDCDSENETELNEVLRSKTKTFPGIRLLETINPTLDDSYFDIKINDEHKFLHKQTACWFLTDKNTRLSSDRLTRVVEMSKQD